MTKRPPKLTVAERARLRHVSPDFMTWRSELEGLLNFLDNEPALTSDFGRKWYQSMRVYNIARAEYLIEARPKTPPNYVLPRIPVK